MKIDKWCEKMRLTREQAAALFCVDIEIIRGLQWVKSTPPQFLALMNYWEIMRQPNIDKAAQVMRKHYTKIKGDHWE